jgi:hypothetical protein
MTTQHERVTRSVLSVLVAFAVVFTAFAVMSSWSSGPSSARDLSLGSSGATVPVRPAAICGQVPVPLASARSYAVLASSTITSTGATHLTGDLGISPGTSLTGFPPGTITGTKNVTVPGAPGAEANLTLAYDNAAGRTNCPVTIAGNIGGQTLTPGLYKSTSSLAISSGDLTLSGGGNPNGVFIFQVASAFTTTSGRQVILSNGAQAGNVFWQIGSSATLGTTSVMVGTVMAHDSVSMLTGSVLTGRAMAETGEVSLADSTITVPTATTSSTYPVTFTETGLAAATSWSVTYGGTTASSTTTTIGFTVVSGTYGFTVDVAGYIAAPGSGSVTVNGAAAGQSVAFTASAAGSFLATFTQSGLSAGTSWSVTFEGVENSSLTPTVGFMVASGTYTFVVGENSNFTASPSSGSMTVNGPGSGQAIAFTNTSGTTGGGGGGGSGSSSTLSSWDWAVIAIVVVAAIVGTVAVVAMRSRGAAPGK